MHLVMAYLVMKAAKPTQPRQFSCYKNLAPSRERIIDALSHSILILDSSFLICLVAHMAVRMTYMEVVTPIDPVQV